MSSILSVINVDEITKRADNIVVVTFRPFEVYMAAALVYFVILFALAQLGRYAEKKLRANVLAS
jgi:polar amino acid transport system permease protein